MSEERRRESYPGCLVYVASWGADVADVCLSMRNIAIKLSVAVECDFNGSKIVIEPDTNIDRVIARYHKVN